MLILLGMGAGIILGSLLRRQQRLLKIVEGSTSGLVYLLLFLLGIAVGGDRQIVAALDALGMQALLLSLGAIGGSLLLVIPLGTRVLPGEKRETDEG